MWPNRERRDLNLEKEGLAFVGRPVHLVSPSSTRLSVELPPTRDQRERKCRRSLRCPNAPGRPMLRTRPWPPRHQAGPLAPVLLHRRMDTAPRSQAGQVHRHQGNAAADRASRTKPRPARRRVARRILTGSISRPCEQLVGVKRVEAIHGRR